MVYSNMFPFWGQLQSLHQKITVLDIFHEWSYESKAVQLQHPVSMTV